MLRFTSPHFATVQVHNIYDVEYIQISMTKLLYLKTYFYY